MIDIEKLTREINKLNSDLKWENKNLQREQSFLVDIKGNIEHLTQLISEIEVAQKSITSCLQNNFKINIESQYNYSEIYEYKVYLKYSCFKYKISDMDSDGKDIDFLSHMQDFKAKIESGELAKEMLLEYKSELSEEHERLQYKQTEIKKSQDKITEITKQLNKYKF